MPDPKKPSTVDQIVDILKSLVTEPMSDQSSHPPTPADVKRVMAEMNPRRRKPVKKARPKPAAKKKRATTKRKATRKKGSSKKATVRLVKRKSARK